MAQTIHPTAIIEPGAELGVDVGVGPYSIIGPHVKIGDRCSIGPHVVIEGFTSIGPESQLSQFCSLGSEPQDLKYRGEPARLIIGARNKIREFVTMHVGTATGSMETVVGDNNLFMANSHVAHDCRVGNNNVFANSAALAGHVRTGDNVILGGLVGVHQFCRIGSYSIISAGSMIGDDIPPFCIGQGDRCFLRGVNVIGLQRAGMSKADIASIRKAYRHLFRTVGSLRTKVDSLPDDVSENPRVKTLVEFITADSKRGICIAAKHSVAGDGESQD
jgi:UDP-N-acetylglucosamine acyltransferase